jgi:hypothetical protein
MTENLLDESDAEAISLEELLDEIFELNDGDISYVGIVKPDTQDIK